MPPINTPDILRQVNHLYECGLYVSAYRAGECLGKLGGWPGVQGRLLAGRLAYQLGRASWGTALHQLALRQYPTDPRALYYGGLALRSRQGPVRAWLTFRDQEVPSSATAEEQADWWSFKASLLGALRDFRRANDYIQRALDRFPTGPWIHLVNADLYRLRDQRDEAISYCHKALDLHRNYRPAAQTLAELYIEANRDDEAYTLLHQAAAEYESPLIAAQLALICMEVGRYQEALEAVDQYERQAILAKPAMIESWLAMMRARTHYRAGNYPETIQYARQAKHEHYDELANRIEQYLRDHRDIAACRKCLPVSFVRQNRSTCAPATLAALSDYWHRPVQHEEIASRICYDGTMSHDERKWALENGFLAKEFCITSQSAHDLINASIPFTLTTVGPSSGHLQAVIGYDSISEILLIRDPSTRTLVEATTEKLLEYYASSGPRGMVMIPRESEGLLQNISLPESHLYDLQYEIDLALSQYDREKGAQVLATMKAGAPNHRLTLQSEFSLSRYDGHLYACSQLNSKLLAQYPKDLRLVLNHIDYCRDFGTRDERIKLLENALTEFGPHPRLKSRLAEELLDDARRHPRAEQELRWLMRWFSGDAHAIALYARLLWEQGKYTESVEFYRLAACLEDKDESYARAFFQGARHIHQTDMALQWLLERHETWGKQSCAPSLTLAAALEELQRIPEALERLKEAMLWRPEDGYLLCNVALRLDRYGQHEEALKLMAQAEGKCHQATILRTAAVIALNHGRLNESRNHYEKLLLLSPSEWSDLDTLLDLDLKLDDPSRGEKRLRERLAHWPECTQLQQRLVSWLRQYRPEALPAELEVALLVDPQSTWLQREATIAAIQRQDWDTAFLHARKSIELEPRFYRNWALLGQIHFDLGQRSETRDAAKRSLECCIDNTWGITLLISTCRSTEEFERDFEYLRDQLRHQTTFGEAILAYYQWAQGRLSSEQCLNDLREAHRERPDLWQSWSALIRHLLYIVRNDEAIALAKQFTERFPFLVEAWLDLAQVYARTNRPDDQLTALRAAIHIDPTSSEIAREISDIHFKRDEPEKAIAVLSDAIAANPRDSMLYGYLADILWSNQQQSEAVENIRIAAKLNPAYDWAWYTLGDWCKQLQRESDAFATAQALLDSQSGQSHAHRRLAQYHLQWEQPSIALNVVREGLAKRPLDVDLHQLHVRALEENGQTNAALSACRPAVFQADIPAELMLLESEILFGQGKYQASIDYRRRALDVMPSSFNGWRTLVEWTEEHGTRELHLEACRRLVALAPSQATAHGYLAAALYNMDATANLNEATKEYELALQLDPEYTFAAYELFFLHLKNQQFESAQELVKTLPESLPAAHRDALILLGRCKPDETDLAKVLRDLCNPSTRWDRSSIRRGLSMGVPAELRSATEQVWRENPSLGALGTLWAEIVIGRMDARKIAESLHFLPVGNTWNTALQCILALPNDEIFPEKLVKKICRKFKNHLRASPESWSAMAIYHLDRGAIEDAYQWTSNWKKIPINDPYQLVSAICVHWLKRRPHESREMLQHALAIQTDQPHFLIVIWKAIDLIFDGKTTGVRESLTPINPNTLGSWYQDVYRVAYGIVSTLEKIECANDRGEIRKLLRTLNVETIQSTESRDEQWERWLRSSIRQKIARRHRLWIDFISATMDKWLNT